MKKLITIKNIAPINVDFTLTFKSIGTINLEKIKFQ